MERREFLARSGRAILALGLGGLTCEPAEAANKQIEWSLKLKKWKSFGPLDLIPQIERAQQWANESLLKYGVVWRPRGCCMRAACMPAEACAHYYSMTGDQTTLKAIEAAVRTFRKYRHRARARRVPYDDTSSGPRPEG
jgi:hypothetical protein